MDGPSTVEECLWCRIGIAFYDLRVLGLDEDIDDVDEMIAKAEHVITLLGRLKEG